MNDVSTRLLALGLYGVLAAACSSSSTDAEPAAPPLMAEASSGSGVGEGEPPAGTGTGLDPAPAGVPNPGESQVPSDTPLAPETVPGETPTAPSEEAGPSLEGDIRFSEPSGTFTGSLAVSIETPIEGAQIRFTLDGSEPGPDAPIYDGTPVVVDGTRQIRAQAYLAEATAGRAGTALYVARTFDVVSDLPLIVVEGYGAGQPMDRDVYVDMGFLVYEPVDGVASLANAPTLATRGGYHLRGQSSASFEQAPYRIELWDNASEDADYPLLGMPAEGDWALIGPYSDRTLIRNAFTYDLGRDMGLSAPRYAFAEVYINQADRALGAEDYQGIYMVVETIKNNSSRLDLAQLEEADVSPEQISGGYIFKFEWAASEAPTLACTGSEPLGGGGFGFGGGMGSGGPGGGNAGGTCWTDLEVVDPDPLVPAQAEFLTDYIQQFHDSLHAEAFANYSQFIDVPSFVDVFIINELTRNLDAYTRSAYYYKDRGEPITAGPLWDFNLTLGMGFGTNLEVVGWQFEERNVASDWYRLLGTDPEFLALVSARWQELRQTLLSEDQLNQRIDALTAPLQNAAVRDFERWPVADVAQGIFQIPPDPTWDGQVQVVRDWLGQRLAWLDSQLN
jgi:CotH protein/chitobiase/beta-hexosaminidase-like protein